MSLKIASETSDIKKYPPILRLDEEDLPELAKWKVGGKYKITLEVQQTSMSKGDEYGEPVDPKEKPKTMASFKVLSVSTDKPSLKPNSMLANRLKNRV